MQNPRVVVTRLVNEDKATMYHGELHHSGLCTIRPMMLVFRNIQVFISSLFSIVQSASLVWGHMSCVTNIFVRKTLQCYVAL